MKILALKWSTTNVKSIWPLWTLRKARPSWGNCNGFQRFVNMTQPSPPSFFFLLLVPVPTFFLKEFFTFDSAVTDLILDRTQLATIASSLGIWAVSTSIKASCYLNLLRQRLMKRMWRKQRMTFYFFHLLMLNVNIILSILHYRYYLCFCPLCSFFSFSYNLIPFITLIS